MKVVRKLRKQLDVFFSCVGQLNTREKRRVYLIVLYQVVLAGLDVIAVGLVAILGTLMVTGIQSQSPGDRIQRVLEVLNLENMNFQNQVAWLAIIAASLLVSKTLITMYFFKKQVFFLTRVTARISKELVSRILSTPHLLLQKRSVFNYIYAIGSGVSSITNGVISVGISLFSDAFLLLALISSLLLVDPIMGFMSTTFFGVTSVLIYVFQSKKARDYSHRANELSIEGDTALNNALNTHKEMTVKARLGYFEKIIHENKDNSAEVRAYLSYMPAVPRYLLDLILVIGGILICGVQFLLNDAKDAFATLSVFLVASSRILPALVRIQQGLVVIRSSVATAEPFLVLTRELPPAKSKQLALPDYSKSQGEFRAQITIRNVDFQYNENEFALHNTNLVIEENTFCAIAGPSGSGKTTLMDLMLGIIEPLKGTVDISGIPANKAPLVFPGAIAYLPQDAQLIEGTVRDNIVLGFHPSEISDSIVWKSLERAQLANLVRSLPMGLDSHIGPRGTGLSGGQRQRLVIARSLVTQPKILFLDEATSALDSETEAAVTESILELKGSMTLIVIAHRLSTIVNADKIVYMRDGKIIEQGNFRSISEKIPQFAKESQLLDLE